MNKRKKTIAIVVFSLLSLTAFSASILSVSNSFADDVTVTTSAAITVFSSCSLSGNNTIPHNAEIFVGHEETEIGNTIMTAQCNDSSGSAIYAVGFSNDTLGTTNMIDSSTNNTIPTGTGTNSSNWSMKLSIPSGNTAPTIRNDATYNFTGYEVVPNSYSLVASFPSSSDGINNSSFSVTYRAYIGGAQTPGTYVGKVKYVLVHPNTMTPANATYTVAYNANGGSGSMSSSTGNYIFDAFTLPANSFTGPNGYNFAGWCTVQDTNQTPQTTCSGTTYINEATIPADTMASGTTLNLYALWSIGSYNLTITFAGTGVDSVKVCTVSGDCTGADLKGTVSTSGGSVSGLVYNTAYYLYPSFTSGYTLDSWSKTDSATGSSLSFTSATNPTYTMGGGNGAVTITGKAEAPGLCTDTATCMQTATTCDSPLVDSRTGVSYLTYTINSKCYMEQNLYLPTGFTLYPTDSNITRASWTTPTESLTAGHSYTAPRMVPGTHTDNTYDVAGGWYNYCAASAGTVCSQTEADATEDICPYGWRLPIYIEMEEVKNADRSNWKFIVGYYLNGSLDSSGSFWWSATASDGSYQYGLYYGGSSLMASDFGYIKNRGFSVRCVRNS